MPTKQIYYQIAIINPFDLPIHISVHSLWIPVITDLRLSTTLIVDANVIDRLLDWLRNQSSTCHSLDDGFSPQHSLLTSQLKMDLGGVEPPS